eukprot:TRINITY_DN2580_c0_g1_i2.p1 TRINITY_DN2580_c0_g1~~TRINITY_DN2580_c0_g1_i2.p1  ORF type:complete len:322 (+),score=81.87 TRINITY_DN2580_c0_g1_i2:33-968(+)
MLRPGAKGAAKRPAIRREEEDDDEGSESIPQQQRQIVRGLKQEELEEYFKEQQNEGVCFRRCIVFVIVATVFFLLWLKWDRESIVADIVTEKILNEDGIETVVDPMDKYYEMFNISKDDKNRRQKVEEAFQRQKEELEKQTEDPDHDRKLVVINDAYNALSTHVVNDYHKVLNIRQRAGYHEVKKAYTKAKQEAEEGKSSYDLAEIKEAYDIMSHPEARVYYNLYGAKPPALMKHQQRVTHGGWGVEIGMGTFKYAILMAWFDYFDNVWVEVGFFVFIFVVLGVKVWNNRHEFMEKIEQLEAMERMAMEGR